MKAMILGAGGGTRLYPLTFAMPKPMVPIMNRPVIEHIIVHLAKHGFDEIMINLNFLPDYFEHYLQDGSRWGVKIRYSYEVTPMGTAGGVKNVEDFFDDTFLVIGGDDLSNIDLTQILDFHRRRGALATIGLTYEDDVSSYGVVVTDSDGRIIDFQEKPKAEDARSHWINNGIYFFEPEILSMLPESQFYDFGSQLFPRLKDEKALFYGCRTDGYWCDVGSLLEYRKAQFDCLSGDVGLSLPGREISPGVWVEEGTVIPDDMIIKPPVLIGRNCRFGRQITVEGPVIMGKYNFLDDYSYLKGSILWNYNHLRRRVRLIDCLVGSECLFDEGSFQSEAVVSSGNSDIFENYFEKKRMVVAK